MKVGARLWAAGVRINRSLAFAVTARYFPDMRNYFPCYERAMEKSIDSKMASDLACRAIC